MPSSAAQPLPPRPGPGDGSGPRRPGRRAALLLAMVGSVVLVGGGLVQAATGLVGGSGTGPAPQSGGSGGPGSSRALAGGSAGGAGSSQAAAGSGSSSQPPVATPAPSSGGPGPSAGPPFAESRAVLRAARLVAELDRLRAKLAIPGVSVAILFPDGTSWSGSSGLADVSTKTPVSPTTAFAFASISKTFTSAVILQLVDEGRLHLTDSATALLPPGLPLAVDRRITVGMLLNHTSGLADYFLNPKIDKALQSSPSRTWTVAAALRYVGKPLSPPGRAWHYSNTNYLLLGLIAERVTGQSLATTIRARLLESTGLDHTWYQGVEASRGPLAHGYRLPGTKVTVRPIDLSDGTGIAPFRSVVTAAAGAGSMAGTSADLARWARALYSGQVLGPAGTGLLLGGFTKTTNYRPGVSYGFGIQALSIAGHPSLGHSGRLLGFQGAVRHFPIDGLTIAVLTNQSRADPAAIVQALLAVALPPVVVCPMCPMAI